MGVCEVGLGDAGVGERDVEAVEKVWLSETSGEAVPDHDSVGACGGVGVRVKERVGVAVWDGEDVVVEVAVGETRAHGVDVRVGLTGRDGGSVRVAVADGVRVGVAGRDREQV